ncbi:hypothetical protein TNCT1_16310 [Streptomyces sp. 1-11]|nr:hypothetical protein TNCT1_16310 [Streptomyces sp. 1-11]
MHAETDRTSGAEINAHFNARLFIACPLRTGGLIVSLNRDAPSRCIFTPAAKRIAETTRLRQGIAFSAGPPSLNGFSMLALSVYGGRHCTARAVES